jgi:hypothetical protein
MFIRALNIILSGKKLYLKTKYMNRLEKTPSKNAEN